MKKKLLTILLSIAVILTSTVTVFAEDTFTINNIKYKVLSGNTVEVTGTTAYFFGGDVTIPSTVTYPETDGTTYTVTAIGENAFNNSDIIDSIVIPNTVTSIGDSAFQQCDKLSSVTLPDGLERIGSYAFNLCIKLTGISIPSSVTNIGNFAFYQCTSMSSVVCNATTPATLGTDAFSKCTALTSIKVPASFVDTYKSSWSSYSTIIEAIPSQNKTISDILPSDFPSSQDSGWAGSSDGYVAYKSNDFLYIKEKSSISVIFMIDRNNIVTKISDVQYKYHNTTDNYDVLFNFDHDKLVSIELTGVTDYRSYLNGIYAAPKTIADILALSNKPFPTEASSGWTNGSQNLFVYNEKLCHNKEYPGGLNLSVTVPYDNGNYKLITQSPNMTSILFSMVDGKLDSITIEGDQDYAGTYVAPITILDILPSNFPTTEASGWVSQDGSKTYINGDNLQSGDILPLNSILTPSGNDYGIIKGDNTFTFVMESGVLSRITMLPALASLVSYYPYAYTNSPVSVQAGNNDIEFVTNGKYVDQTTTEVKVSVDNNPLTYDTDYEVSTGSTHVKLKGSFVSTLPVGTHTLKTSMDGYDDITTQFTITAAPSPTPTPEPEQEDTPRYKVPNTGVEGTYSNNHSLLKLSSLSLLAVGTYIVIKKNNDY